MIVWINIINLFHKQKLKAFCRGSNIVKIGEGDHRKIWDFEKIFVSWNYLDQTKI